MGFANLKIITVVGAETVLLSGTNANTHTEQEIDGESFLELSNEHIQILVPKIGPQSKLIKRRNLLRAQQPQVPPCTKLKNG